MLSTSKSQWHYYTPVNIVNRMNSISPVTILNTRTGWKARTYLGESILNARKSVTIFSFSLGTDPVYLTWLVDLKNRNKHVEITAFTTNLIKNDASEKLREISNTGICKVLSLIHISEPTRPY